MNVMPASPAKERSVYFWTGCGLLLFVLCFFAFQAIRVSAPERKLDGKQDLAGIRDVETPPLVPNGRSRKDGGEFPDLRGMSNPELVELLEDSEARRIIRKEEVTEGPKEKVYIDVDPPSGAELIHLRAAAYAAKGTVGENLHGFGDTSQSDQPLSDYLIERFSLRQGSGVQKIIVSFDERAPGVVSYSSSVKLPGTGRTEVVGGRLELRSGWRFDKILDVGLPGE